MCVFVTHAGKRKEEGKLGQLILRRQVCNIEGKEIIIMLLEVEVFIDLVVW